MRALDFNTLRGELLDLVGEGWSQALSMYFFSGEFAVHDFFLDI